MEDGPGGLPSLRAQMRYAPFDSGAKPLELSPMRKRKTDVSLLRSYNLVMDLSPLFAFGKPQC